MPVWDQEVLKMHEIDDELTNMYSNAFQKEIDQEGSRTPSMTIFSYFLQEIIEYFLS